MPFWLFWLCPHKEKQANCDCIKMAFRGRYALWYYAGKADRRCLLFPWIDIADIGSASWIHGLKIVAVAIVAQAVLISKADFLAGYGAAQAVPGPLFTFAGYLGAMINGVTGAFIATAAIFLPAFLLIVEALPFWNSSRKSSKVRGALIGINAAVVGTCWRRYIIRFGQRRF